MIIPTVAYSIWLSYRNKIDERHKLLANAILELGSIAQEEVTKESVIRLPITKIATKRRIPKRKK